jgi:hypothetical protein
MYIYITPIITNFYNFHRNVGVTIGGSSGLSVPRGGDDDDDGDDGYAA